MKLIALLLFFVSLATARSETIYAIVQGGEVTNVIVADQSFIDSHFPGSPRIDALSPRPGIGWGFDGTTWTAPQTFAVVSVGVVTQIVTGLPARIASQYPGAIRIDNLSPVPSAGWTYANGVFAPPAS